MTEPRVVSLEAESSRLELDLARGGRITSLATDGLEFIVQESDPHAESILHWGCYVMAPWCSRVRRGEFGFAGRKYRLPLRMPPHAIHGTVLDRPWRVEAGDKTSCVLSTELGEDWPWLGFARQHIRLSRCGVVLTLEVHAEDEAFPASLGWHPWFLRQLARGQPAELDFEANQIYRVDGEGLPTGETESPGVGPFDDCFREVVRDPVIRWPHAIELTLSTDLDHWVVYDQPSHALCVEPVSGPPNVLNGAPRTVEPGCPLSGEFRIDWERLA